MISYIKNLISKMVIKREMGKKGLLGSRKRRKQEGTLAHSADKSIFLGLIILSLVSITCVMVLVTPNQRKAKLAIDKDGNALEQVTAEVPFSYEDINQTEKNKKDAVDSLSVYFKINSDKTREFIKSLNTYIDEVFKDPSNPDFTNGDTRNIQQLITQIPKTDYKDLTDVLSKNEFRSQLVEVFEKVLRQGVISQDYKNKIHDPEHQCIITDEKGRSRNILLKDIPAPIECIDFMLGKLDYSMFPDLKKGVSDTLSKHLSSLIESGNLVNDEDRYNQRVKDIEKTTPKVMVSVQKGDSAESHDPLCL